MSQKEDIATSPHFFLVAQLSHSARIAVESTTARICRAQRLAQRFASFFAQRLLPPARHALFSPLSHAIGHCDRSGRLCRPAADQNLRGRKSAYSHPRAPLFSTFHSASRPSDAPTPYITPSNDGYGGADALTKRADSRRRSLGPLPLVSHSSSFVRAPAHSSVIAA